MPDKESLQIEADNSLLILDDDEPFLRRLSKAMEKRGFQVFPANTMKEFQLQDKGTPQKYYEAKR